MSETCQSLYWLVLYYWWQWIVSFLDMRWQSSEVRRERRACIAGCLIALI